MQTAGSLLVRPMPGGKRQVTGKNGCGRPDRMAEHTKSHARNCGQPQWPDANRPMQPDSTARQARHSMGPCRTEKGRRQRLVVDQPVFPPAPPPAKQPPVKRWRRYVGAPHGLLQHPALERCTAHGRRDRRGVEPQMTDTQRIEAVEKPLHPQTPRLLRKNSPIDLFPAPVQELPPVGQVAQAEPCRGEMHGACRNRWSAPNCGEGSNTRSPPTSTATGPDTARRSNSGSSRTFEAWVRESKSRRGSQPPPCRSGRSCGGRRRLVPGGRTAPQGNGPLRAGDRKPDIDIAARTKSRHGIEPAQSVALEQHHRQPLFT